MQYILKIISKECRELPHSKVDSPHFVHSKECKELS